MVPKQRSQAAALPVYEVELYPHLVREFSWQFCCLGSPGCTSYRAYFTMQTGQESRSSSVPSCSALPSFLTIQEGQLWNLGSYKTQTTALFRQGVKPAAMSNCWAQPLTPHNQEDWTISLGNLRTQLWSHSTTEHSLQPHPIMEPRQNSSQPERQFLDPPICEIQQETAPNQRGQLAVLLNIRAQPAAWSRSPAYGTAFQNIEEKTANQECCTQQCCPSGMKEK